MLLVLTGDALSSRYRSPNGLSLTFSSLEDLKAAESGPRSMQARPLLLVGERLGSNIREVDAITGAVSGPI